MIITKKAIPRRTVLRGIGATLALPLLDSMVPALTAAGRTAAKPTSRLGAIYVPNGIMMNQWTPAAEGAGFEFTPILKPLEPFRDQILVLSGLSQVDRPGLGTGGSGVHARPAVGWLTGIVNPKQTAGAGLQADISMDQMAAKTLGEQTQLASLELALESTEFVGSCDVGWSCAYFNISWRSPNMPMPRENNPRAVFERLFGDSGSTDPTVLLARVQKDRSILDSVTQTVARLNGGLGPRDRTRLSQYLEAIRDVERRVQRAEEQRARELPVVEQPAGIPATYEEHAKLMFDLQVLAYQSDLTRVITFMIGRELSGQTYPQIGVPDAHHPISHHSNDLEKMAKVAKINTYHATLFAYYLEKLRATPDGDGSLLDHMMILYGSPLSDGNRHDHYNVPVLVAGGGAGQLKGGRHIRYPANTPLPNLHATLLDKVGVPAERVGDSTGRLKLHSLSGV